MLAPWTTITYRLKRNQGTADPNASSGADRIGNPNPGSSAAAADLPPSVDNIVAKAATFEQIPQAIEEITEVLRQRHGIRPGQENDFNIRDLSELLKTMSETLKVPVPRGS